MPTTAVTMKTICVPDDAWAINSQHVVKVVLRGTGASELPPDVFVQALFENGVLEDNIVSNFKYLYDYATQ